MSSPKDKLRETLEEKAYNSLCHYSLMEVKKDEVIIGTPDDTVLDPEFDKEFFLKSITVGEARVVLKTLGVGRNKPVSVYINDERWELFPGPQNAEKTCREFIESGEYRKWLERRSARKQAMEQKSGAGEEGTDELVNDRKEKTPGQTPGSTGDNPVPPPNATPQTVPESVIDQLKNIAKRRRPSKVVFREHKEKLMVDSNTASMLLAIRESLNKKNKGVYDSMLEDSRQSFLKMVDFGLENTIRN
tara:strand:- start:17 stop:754 length:738 start_codon:yes stop_codon:yes gene_type:complete